MNSTFFTPADCRTYYNTDSEAQAQQDDDQQAAAPATTLQSAEIKRRHVVASLFKCPGKVLSVSGLSMKHNGAKSSAKLYPGSKYSHKISEYQAAIWWLNSIGLTEYHKDEERIGDRGLYFFVFVGFVFCLFSLCFCVFVFLLFIA